MVDKGFAVLFRTYSNLFGVSFDDAKMRDWHDVLGEYAVDKLLLAVKDLARSHATGFPPTIGQIVERHDAMKSRHFGDLDERARMIGQKNAEGVRCDVCGNSGLVFYNLTEDGERFLHTAQGDGGMYLCRCYCPHGVDVSKVAKGYVDRGSRYYKRTVDEMFSREQIERWCGRFDLGQKKEYYGGMAELVRQVGRIFDLKGV